MAAQGANAAVPVAAVLPTVSLATMTVVDAAFGIATAQIQVVMLAHSRDPEIMTVLTYLLFLMMVASLYCTCYRLRMNYRDEDPNCLAVVCSCLVTPVLLAMHVVKLLQYGEGEKHRLKSPKWDILTTVLAFYVTLNGLVGPILRSWQWQWEWHWQWQFWQ